jgi:hypothetical protein
MWILYVKAHILIGEVAYRYSCLYVCQYGNSSCPDFLRCFLRNTFRLGNILKNPSPHNPGPGPNIQYHHGDTI